MTTVGMINIVIRRFCASPGRLIDHMRRHILDAVGAAAAAAAAAEEEESEISRHDGCV